MTNSDRGADESTRSEGGASVTTPTSVVAALLRTRLAPLRLIVIATLVVATADAAFAFVIYVLIARRYNFETLLQYIASGVAGDAAFTTGLGGVGYAALGFGIHLVLAMLVVVAYRLVFAPLVNTRTVAVIVGLAYGAGIWLFMNAAVLPLGQSEREEVFGGYYAAFLIGHALLIGLPIALIMLGVSRNPLPQQLSPPLTTDEDRADPTGK